MTLSATLGGKPSERKLAEERVYEAKDGGRLLYFKVDFSGDGGEQTLIGRCSPEGIQLVRKRPGLPDEIRRLPPTDDRVEQADPARWVALTGRTLEGVSLDTMEKLKDEKSVTTLVEKTRVTLAGVNVPVVRVSTKEESSHTPVISTVSEDGRILEIRYGEVMVARLEEEKVARQLDQVDLFALTRVVLDKPIPAKARKAPAELVLRVNGLPEPYRKDSYRQKFEVGKGGDVRLTIRAFPPMKSAKLPIKPPADDQELKEALTPGLSVESDAPEIQKLAKKVVGGEKDAWAAARKLSKFVYNYLEKSYGTSSDRATDVLRTRRGDCTEHALLFTALARAAGIPARRVDGVVYTEAEDRVPALYWHEWAEVWVGEWVAIDPTFNQDVADPTHIALGSEGRSDSAALIGQLKVAIEKVR